MWSKTATSNHLQNQVSGTVVLPSSISANSRRAPTSAAYLAPNHEAGSTLCNDNFEHTAQTQNTYPAAAECPARVYGYNSQPVNELSYMRYLIQQSSHILGRPSYDGMFLPRPEFPQYSDDLLEYNPFIINFETHVKPRIKDQKMLFCLLTQHCVIFVRERVQHLEGKEQRYQLAKQRILKEYGSPWKVSDVCEQKLKSFFSITSDNSKQIKRFAELLEKTYSIMTGISNFGSLDSLDSLTILVT